MNAVTGFAAIVSILVALAAGGATTQSQAGITVRKAGEQQGDTYLMTSKKLATNHNETLVRDTAPVK
jgi:hypothetical protein